MFQMFSLDFSVWIKLFSGFFSLGKAISLFSSIIFYCNDTKAKTTKHNGLSLFVFAILLCLSWKIEMVF